jgi:hypothetical protein
MSSRGLPSASRLSALTATSSPLALQRARYTVALMEGEASGTAIAGYAHGAPRPAEGVRLG